MTCASSQPVPQLPGPRLPWLGHTLSFGRDPVRFLAAGRERVGGTFGFTLLGKRVVFTSGPPAHEQVLQADDYLLSVQDAYPYLRDMFGPGIAYDAGPEVQRTQRSYLLAGLTPKRVNGYVPLMHELIEAHLEGWGDQGEVDLPEAMGELVAAITTRCLLGVEFYRQISADAPRLFADLSAGIRLAALLPFRLPLPAFRRRDRARQTLLAAIHSALDNHRATGMGEQDGMLDVLVDARTSSGEPVPDEIIASILLAAGFAGMYTSSAMAVWTGITLLSNPEHLSDLRAEQSRVVTAPDALSAEQLHRMELLERCMRETERLYPPGAVMLRKAMREFVLDGYSVPKGTLVMLSPAVSHRMPEIFSDPDRFDPGRYERGRAEHRRPCSMIAFGGGTHRCVGYSFAGYEIKAIWSVLLRRFELELVGGPHRVDYSTSFVSTPSAPCRLRFRRTG